MYRNPDIVMREVKPAHFLVDITKSYNSKEETMLEIDEMGVAIWNCIEPGMSRADIVSAFLALLTNEKDESFVAMVTKDVNEFLDLLASYHCVLED